MIGQAENGRQAVEMAQNLKPNTIMMDISMPEMDGIEATRIIHKDMPQVRIVGLSMHNDPEKAEMMKKAGAAAYIVRLPLQRK